MRISVPLYPGWPMHLKLKETEILSKSKNDTSLIYFDLFILVGNNILPDFLATYCVKVWVCTYVCMCVCMLMYLLKSLVHLVVVVGHPVIRILRLPDLVI